MTAVSQSSDREAFVAVCQNFESNCKYVLKIAEMGVGLEEGHFKDLDEAVSATEKLLHLFLDKAIRRFANVGVKESDVAVLLAAKNARNYIAHEAALHALYVPPPHPPPNLVPLLPYRTHPPLDLQLPRLRRDVRALAEGDGLVSTWGYWIEEKGAPVPIIGYIYPEFAETWVLGPLGTSGLERAFDRTLMGAGQGGGFEPA